MRTVKTICKRRFAKGLSTPGVPLLHKYVKVKTMGHTIPLVRWAQIVNNMLWIGYRLKSLDLNIFISA